MYIYKRTGSEIFTVGYYDPHGKFITEMVCPEKDEAAERIHYLNGGVNPELFSEVIEHLYSTVATLHFLVEDLNRRLDRERK